MKYTTFDEEGEYADPGMTSAELRCHEDPEGWGKWYFDNDKTRKQPALLGFERCRNCIGTGHTPAGAMAPLTGFPCGTCRGRGVVAETCDDKPTSPLRTLGLDL